MQGQIFISYRRDDEAGTAGRLYDHLIRVGKVPREKIFTDVYNIVPGMSFVRELQSRMSDCELMVAVIGRRWLGAVDEHGELRLSDPHDFVRLELEAALSRSIPLIPLLVDGARMPKLDELPPSLQPLCEQQGVDVRNANFDSDIQPLVRAIEWHRSQGKKPSQPGGPTEVAAAPVHPPANKGGPKPPKPSPSGHSTAPPSRASRSELSKLGGLFYLSEAGNAQSLYEVGTRLEAGHGITKDLVLAREYYERAAKAGYERAKVRLERLKNQGISKKK